MKIKNEPFYIVKKNSLSKIKKHWAIGNSFNKRSYLNSIESIKIFKLKMMKEKLSVKVLEQIILL